MKRAFLYIGSLLFTYRIYYIYSNTLDEASKAEFTPRVQNATLKTISTWAQIEELIAEGFDFSYYPDMEDIKRRLEKQTVLFCVFVGKELAHRSWLSMTKESRWCIDPHPYMVDYQRGESCVGLAGTNPKYQGAGLYTYVYSQIYRFLREKGYSEVIFSPSFSAFEGRWDKYMAPYDEKGDLKGEFALDHNKLAPQKAQAKLGSKFVGEGRYVEILGWKFWREKLVNEGYSYGITSRWHTRKSRYH